VKTINSQEQVKQKSICPDRMEIIMLIESLRSELETVIDRNQNYTDPKVLAVSRKLDKAINEFCQNYSTSISET